MAPDEGDLERWQELPGLDAQPSSVEALLHPDERSAGGNIDRLVVGGDTYTHTLRDGRSLRVRHEVEKGLSFQLWPSSLTLVRHAEEKHHCKPSCWKGVRVLELGCGCGLAGLVFAALGATVALTDLPATKDMIDSNIMLNSDVLASTGGLAVSFPLCWGSTDLEGVPESWRHPDLIVAADVIYHKHLFQPLLQTLKTYAGPFTPILLAHVRRWKDDNAFFSAARKAFLIEDLSNDQSEPTESSKQRHEFRRRGALCLYCLQTKSAEGKSNQT